MLRDEELLPFSRERALFLGCTFTGLSVLVEPVEELTLSVAPVFLSLTTLLVSVDGCEVVLDAGICDPEFCITLVSLVPLVLPLPD